MASQRPPLPPKIENRSHSYDGLLGDDKKRATEGQDHVDAKHISKSAEASPDTGKSTEESIKTKNRRSRSMDDLFDDDRSQTNFLENTQSMENLLSEEPPIAPESPVKVMGNICLNRRFVENPEEVKNAERDLDVDSPESCSEQPCENEIITVDNTPRTFSEPAEKTAPEDDVLSTNSSLNSFASSTGSKKSSTPFINKYVKKVKSLMKK